MSGRSDTIRQRWANGVYDDATAKQREPQARAAARERSLAQHADPAYRQRYAEGIARAVAAGRCKRVGHRGDVPVEPIREAVLAEIRAGESWASICYRLGWRDRNGRASTSRLQRALGLRPSRRSHVPRLVGSPRTITTLTTAMRIETALRIVVFGLHRDPVEFDL
jgi:hypothetical protein